jgi:hypothetical protein
MDANLGADNQAPRTESQVIIFSSPKPRQANTEAVQISAFRSWRRIFPKARILLFGDGATWESFAHEEGLELAGPLPVGAEGGEVIRCLFEKTSKLAGDGLAMYLNSDILLDPSALTAVARLESLPGPWLASARRCCLTEWAGPALKQDEEWQRFYQRAREESVWGPACAMDMFLFRGISFEAMPPFLIGHRGWDNWMIYHARSQNISVIDVSAAMRIIHCEHDYSYGVGNQNFKQRRQARENVNLHLIGGEAKLFHLGHATHELRSGALSPRSGWALRQRNMEFWCITHPEHVWWVRILRRIFHPVIKKVEKITARHEDWQTRDPRIIRDL